MKTTSLIIGQRKIDLVAGEWSPIFEVSFKAGFGMTIKALTRAILMAAGDDPQMYFLPLQPHALNPPWLYATPKGFVKDLWEHWGPFLTLGWPQDTTALEENWMGGE